MTDLTGLTAKVTAALGRSVLPSVIARGAAVQVASLRDGTRRADRAAPEKLVCARRAG